MKGINLKLQKILDSDDLDWDNSAHREAYLKAWLDESPEDHEDLNEE